jgi:hypothetical protein
LIGIVSPDLVAVFFGLEDWGQVDSGPDLFAGEFTEGEESGAWLVDVDVVKTI